MTAVDVAIVQNAPDHTTPEANREVLLDAIRRTTRDGARLVLFPECAATGYAITDADEVLARAEPLHGPTAGLVGRLCAETGAHVVYGFLERDGAHVYNTAAVVGPAGVVGAHRKAHIAPVGADAFVTPGDRIAVVEAAGVRLGLSICYEVRFPELARCQALMGAQMLIVVANWPAGADVNPDIMAPARAAENNLPLLAANRCGRDGDMSFLGRSAVYGSDGRIVTSAGDAETTLYASVAPGTGPGRVAVNESGYFVDLRAHRRPELYAAITASERGPAGGEERH